MSLQDLQNGSNTFDPSSSHDDFLEQMLCGLQSGVSWPDISAGTGGGGGGGGQNKPAALPWDVDQFDDQSTFLATKLRQHQISTSNPAAKSLLLQQQLMLSRGLAGGNGDSGVFPNDLVDASSFKSPSGDNSIQTLFNGFSGSLQSNQSQDFHYPSAQTFGSPGVATTIVNQGTTTGGTTTASGGSGPPAQPRQRVRARRGQATDPHSIAERLRRERIADRMKSLQELVPNANKTDKASMLDEIIDYVKFLQLQVKVLSMSRLGGAAAVAPLVADMSTEGGRDCVSGPAGGAAGRSSNGTTSSSNNDTMTVAENQVVKLMEEDMGSAMQYLQGKGLCLMPISLATAISTATCQPSSSRNNYPLLGGSEGGGPSSPNLSVLTNQSINGVRPSEVAPIKDLISINP